MLVVTIYGFFRFGEAIIYKANIYLGTVIDGKNTISILKKANADAFD